MRSVAQPCIDRRYTASHKRRLKSRYSVVYSR
nr:MAG TPA: hypothetical protein [Caudoviricetes sp.]